MNNKRNSKVELLKIIAIFLIVLSHSVPFYGDPTSVWYVDGNVSTLDIQLIIIKFFRIFGQIGNVIFITCSSWFLLENGKTNAKKIIEIMFDSWIISVIFLIIALIFNFEVGFTQIIKQLLPITFKNNWFIGCYLLFYLIHPYLNIIVEKINKNQLLKINIINFILYCIIYLVLHNDFYFNELIGFIIIYFFVAYTKKYLIEFCNNKKMNLTIIIICIILHVSSVLATNYIGFVIPMLANKCEHWNMLINPLYILFSISLINLCNINRSNNIIINYISSLTLLIYLFSENILFKSTVFPKIFNFIYTNIGYTYISLIILGIGIVSFAITILVSIVYKIIVKKHLNKLIEYSEKIIKIIYCKIEKKFLKLK